MGKLFNLKCFNLLWKIKNLIKESPNIQIFVLVVFKIKFTFLKLTYFDKLLYIVFSVNKKLIILFRNEKKMICSVFMVRYPYIEPTYYFID